MKFNKQSGSVMIEAAFIVPIVILAVILTIDAVNYGAERIMLNNAVMSVNQTWKERMDQTGLQNSLAPFKCEGGLGSEVVFDGTENESLAKLFKNSLNIKQDVEVTSRKSAGDMIADPGSILDKTYTFRIVYPFNGLVLPSVDVGTYMMYTLDATCGG